MGSDCGLAEDESCPKSKTGKPEDFEGCCAGCPYLEYIWESEEGISQLEVETLEAHAW